MESLSKPPLDGREQAQGLVDLAVLSPQPSKVHPGKQVPPDARDQVPFDDELRRALRERNENVESSATDLERDAIWPNCFCPKWIFRNIRTPG